MSWIFRNCPTRFYQHHSPLQNPSPIPSSTFLPPLHRHPSSRSARWSWPMDWWRADVVPITVSIFCFQFFFSGAPRRDYKKSDRKTNEDFLQMATFTVLLSIIFLFRYVSAMVVGVGMGSDRGCRLKESKKYRWKEWISFPSSFFQCKFRIKTRELNRIEK